MGNTIAVFGSARRHGNTGQLMDRVARDLNIDVIDLASHTITAYDYEHRNRSDDFEALIARLLEFDQIIFASPVYWYAVSSTMKVFLDRVSDFLELPDLLENGRRLRGKRGFIVSTSISEEVAPAFLSAFRDTFTYLGMGFGAILHANCADGYIPHKCERDVEAFVSCIAVQGSK